MKIPSPSDNAVRIFHENVEGLHGIEVRKVFGQPSAFVGGNMFFGVFGDLVFLRLSESDRGEIMQREGARPFEPMPGRAMSEYVTMPESLIIDSKRLAQWLGRSLLFARALPPKAAKSKGRAAKH